MIATKSTAKNLLYAYQFNFQHPGARYAEDVEEITDEAVEHFVEELTKEELEELEVVKVAGQMKEEL